jgi:hypothetical protein
MKNSERIRSHGDGRRPTDPTYVARLFEALTGRKPTPEETAATEARRKAKAAQR